MTLHRREFLTCCSAGFGLYHPLALAAEAHGGRPLAPQPGHHTARAKQLIFIFLTGGVSQVDTFDCKPKLLADQGKIVTAPNLREVAKEPLLASPFKFQRVGQSGLMISELFPGLGSVVDDLCIIRTMHTDIVEHFQAALAMHTGSATVPLPSIGAWLSYGLGSFNANLPSHIVLCEHLPYGGSQLWDSNFLPADHQATRIITGNDPIRDLRPPAQPIKLADLEERMLQDVNDRHAQKRPDDSNLRARMNSFDTARGMMREAPKVFDLADEPNSTFSSYGLDPGDNRSFAAQCVLTRRLIEHGVRVVELIDSGASNNWDAHGNMEEHRPKAKRVDRPLAALIRDLKQRGLLDQTLVAICTEFGRTPWSTTKGRNHYARAFTSLLAGGGVKGGIAYGQTDEYGIEIVADPCHVHDYHATILHLMGIDHTRLTYRYAGRDFRLTDVAGKVVNAIFA